MNKMNRLNLTITR